MSGVQAETAVHADFRVVVFSRGSDPGDMAATLSESLGLNRVDAKIHAAHVPGILPDLLTREQAERVVADIRKLGVTATVVACSDIPQLNHPQTIHHAACLPDGLEILGLTGARSGFIAWEDLEFLSVGHIPLEAAHHYSTESNVVIRSSPHTFDEETEGVAVSGPACWIIARNPQRVFFLDHGRMNYDYLGERASSSAAANFREFLRDLTGFATQAWLTPATHAILDRGSASDYVFRDAEQFRQTTVLQYLLYRAVENEHLPKHDPAEGDASPQAGPPTTMDQLKGT